MTKKAAAKSFSTMIKRVKNDRSKGKMARFASSTTKLRKRMTVIRAKPRKGLNKKSTMKSS